MPRASYPHSRELAFWGFNNFPWWTRRLRLGPFKPSPGLGYLIYWASLGYSTINDLLQHLSGSSTSSSIIPSVLYTKTWQMVPAAPSQLFPKLIIPLQLSRPISPQNQILILWTTSSSGVRRCNYMMCAVDNVRRNSVSRSLNVVDVVRAVVVVRSVVARVRKQWGTECNILKQMVFKSENQG